MSKKFKPKASSSRAAAGGFGAFGGFSTASSQSFAPSSLSYIAEPPDLSQISEPLLVVPFKNLSKKDDTTKTKALEDIKDHLGRIREQGAEVEEGVLEAWAKVYPRASIENARRIRQLAHIIQGHLAALAGKRIARHLPNVIGAWLAGLYDNDRVVSRTAAESISDVFPTEEKRNNLWRVFLGPVLEFAEDVILHQTVKTLSDERIVKPDDAEAKFARVSATAILLLNRILSFSSSEQLEKHQGLIETLLNSRNLWGFAHHEDPFARRAVYSLLHSVVRGGLDVDWQVISSVIIGKAISTPQLMSAGELSETLLLITQTRPQFWTTDYTGKTSVVKRLQQYIKKGSQGATESFWSNLVEILKLLPREILAKYGGKDEGEKDLSYAQAMTLMNDFSEGLGSRDEPRQNLTAGWISFVELGLWLSAVLKIEEKRELIRSNILPIFEQYVLKPPEPSRYTLPSQTGKDICASAFVRIIEHGHQETLNEFWIHITEALLEAVKLSRPEQSKDFRSSQDEVSGQATRFFTLQKTVLSRMGEGQHQQEILKMFQTTNVPLLEGSLQVLHSRNGKPYAAAAMLEQAIRNVPEVVKNAEGLLATLRELVPALLLSPSSEHIVSIILLCRGWKGFDTILKESLKKMTATESTFLSPAVLKLLATVNMEDISDTSDFISVVMKRLRKALDGDESEWSAVLAVSQNPGLPDEVLDNIVTAIVDALSSDSVADALHGLSLLLDKSPKASKHLKSGVHGPRLIGKLIHLSESAADEIAHEAESLERRLKELVPKDVSATSDLEVVKHHLLKVGPESLSVESLVGIAKELIQNCKEDDIPKLGSSILPSRETWTAALEVFLALPPRPSTVITSPLGGTVSLIQHHLPESVSKNLENVARDSNNASAALRLTAFTTEILSSSSPSLLLSIGQDHREGIFYYFPLAIQLIDDDLSIEGSINITGLELPEDRDEYLGIVNRGRSIINSWINSKGVSEMNGALSEEFLAFWDRTIKSLTTGTPESYRVGETYAKIMSQTESSPDTDTLVGLTREIRKMNVMRAAATLAVWGPAILSNAAGTRLCNELVAEITGIDLEKDPVHGLTNMTMLNILVQGDRSVIGSIPTQRVVFLVKRILESLQSGSGPLSALAEGFKILAIALPSLGEIYGSHWAESLDLLDKTWKEMKAGDAELPVLHASLRLFGLLNSMANGDGNDDLEDAWKDSKGTLFESLVSLLSRIDAASEHYQPRDMTVDILRRHLNTISVESIPNVESLFSLLAVRCSAIQRAAFEVLHRYIPKAQQEVSFEVALSKTTVHLPDELLSLLLEPPHADALSAAAEDASVWVGLRSYLLSWKIVFDHFTNSSVPVQENYATDIKEHGALNPLLEFTFDFLQKGGKLIDVSKLQIKTFELDESESPEKEVQWLLVHLYFLSLKHLPALTKSWWLDSKKKIKGPVEAWTEKYISPSIIEEALQGVVDWIQTQDKDEERPLTVKVSWNTAELIASIVVDDESPPVAIAVNLPRAYPLQPAVVAGRSRVLVDEKKWQSWLLVIQGVIMFSHNLVDGLLAFRRNVQGALKGQSECAICYSVISTDMQTPNKACATCKNTFHSVCLFRWFKSSNQSTCPLCRNNFVYV